jgi:hypothetical protein
MILVTKTRLQFIIRKGSIMLGGKRVHVKDFFAMSPARFSTSWFISINVLKTVINLDARLLLPRTESLTRPNVSARYCSVNEELPS